MKSLFASAIELIPWSYYNGSMSFLQILGILGGVVGITGGVLGILSTVRRRQLSTPRFEFFVGSSARETSFPASERQIPVGIVSYGSAADDVDFYVCMPFMMRNTGKIAIQNVRVLLQYPREYAVADFSILKTFTGRIYVKGIKERDVDLDSRVAHVSYDIPILRPGEGLGFADPLHFGPRTKHRKIDAGLEATGTIDEHLSRIESLNDAFAMALFVRSENTDPIAHLVPVFWFKSPSIKEL